MSKRQRPLSFRQQMRRSVSDLATLMARGQSPSGNGTFSVRTIEVAEPSVYDARLVQRTRSSLKLSQALFARLLGVSGSLVRAWELGTRRPAPIARRLLDQVRANPARFAALVRASKRAGRRADRSTKIASNPRPRKVA